MGGDNGSWDEIASSGVKIAIRKIGVMGARWALNPQALDRNQNLLPIQQGGVWYAVSGDSETAKAALPHPIKSRVPLFGEVVGEKNQQ